jgi:hypothetical protein
VSRLPAHADRPRPYIGNNNQDNTTPYKTNEYVSGGKLYFPVQKRTAPFEYGVLCAD